MNYLSLISNAAAKHAAPVASRAAQAQREKEEGQRAARDLQNAEKVRRLWLNAMADDALLIAFGQPMPEVMHTLSTARNGLIFVLYGLSQQVNAKGTIEYILGTIQTMQDCMGVLQQGGVPEKTGRAIAAGVETARIALQAMLPIQVIKASFEFAEKHPNLILHGMEVELQEKYGYSSRKTLSVKKHAVIFGQKAA